MGNRKRVIIMSRPVKPDREPDYTYKCWHFYFDEMAQWNDTTHLMFHIRIVNSKMQYLSNNHNWIIYSAEDLSTLSYNAYLKWEEILHKILLGGYGEHV